MAKLEVLLPGYVREDEAGEHVRGTVTLVRSGDLVIVTDPGLMTSQSELVEPLRERGIEVTDVTHVFVSHHHIDHTRNIGMFPDAVVIDVDSTYDGDIWGEHDGDGYRLDEDVSVIETPGHSFECASLIVRTDDLGVVAVTHAWWFEDMTPETDPLASDQALLDESRERILGIADWIVPGHGPAFAAPRTR